MRSLGLESCFTPSMRSIGVKQSMDHIAIELTGSEPATVMQETDEATRHKKICIWVLSGLSIKNRAETKSKPVGLGWFQFGFGFVCVF
ncbi:hypothetical protein NC653_007957 [Populus alba x Populus x berolinensis]|uniref:Uncharacterized protein n=2 Tax=Populus alba x Populus x berolinensis TaxID=444605 RepID=A0AAD6W8G2_9ROSI|nr:hypothetical protein NC653_007957 [Populus alba x Populus x berolinensis]